MNEVCTHRTSTSKSIVFTRCTQTLNKNSFHLLLVAGITRPRRMYISLYRFNGIVATYSMLKCFFSSFVNTHFDGFLKMFVGDHRIQIDIQHTLYCIRSLLPAKRTVSVSSRVRFTLKHRVTTYYIHRSRYTLYLHRTKYVMKWIEWMVTIERERESERNENKGGCTRGAHC